MQAVSVSDRRHSPRRVVNRVTKIQFGGNAAPRESFLADVSTGGVQLSVEGFKIPDEFVLLLSGAPPGMPLPGGVEARRPDRRKIGGSHPPRRRCGARLGH